MKDFSRGEETFGEEAFMAMGIQATEGFWVGVFVIIGIIITVLVAWYNNRVVIGVTGTPAVASNNTYVAAPV